MIARRRSIEEWTALIADYASRTSSAREWIEQHGVTKDQLAYWRTRLSKATGDDVQWTSLQVVDQETHMEQVHCTSIGNTDGITVHIGPARIQVRPGFDQQLLSEVIRVVVASC
jgi:transposase-like protein